MYCYGTCEVRRLVLENFAIIVKEKTHLRERNMEDDIPNMFRDTVFAL